MKNLSSFVLAIGLLLSTSFAQNFEGIMIMEVTTQGTNLTQEYKIKGDKAVAEIKVGGIPIQRMYADGTKKEVYVLQETGSKKTAVRIKINEDKENPNKKPKVTETKETKTILGYTCTKIIVEDGKKTTTAWVSKDITKQLNIDFDKVVGGMAKNNVSKYGFPLELEIKDENNVSTTKVTKIEKSTVDDAIFPNLSEYEIQEMPIKGLR
ncbi:MAG: DUF4412 domain-containing protein [Bacteroidia bacterium]|nr:DUF4412 domain-containing protein [Bacteroidia bacterium]MDW8303109.1 DUF4412 domain-containing protein [Bacteroidia bacterium]